MEIADTASQIGCSSADDGLERKNQVEFAVGDKVVHPYHGPGTISSIEQRDFTEGLEHYYVIEIPGQGLTLHVPKDRMAKIGVRPAMARTQLARMLKTLRGRPHRLPADYKERQELVAEKLKTARPKEIAEAVRDLTWYQNQAHLTKRDSEYLDRGRQLLAAEVALVSDLDVAEANKMIDTTLTTALAAGSE